MTTGGFDPNQGQNFNQQPHQQFGQQTYGQAAPGQDQFGQQPGYGQPGPQFGGQPPYGQAPAGGPYPGAGPARPGELGARFGARFIDGLILLIPLLFVNGILVFTIGGFVGSFLGAVVTAAGTIGYFVLMETTRGQSVGKMVFKLHVLGPDGGLPTQQQSLIRNAFYAISVLGSLPIIGFLFGLVGIAVWIVIAVTINSSPTKQGKHDELAGGTRVVQA
ncbi:RDD family protein [Rhodococcus triatomae]|uniref:Uncharacterized membrane protein YckC, RDD family n=1 Tax=Rhodococcus triatomae TaxID=300028 RepID=A0A1G8I9D5_9NOCA|nr:RDD family protein [Rhodococcus triatomae]QNG20993.1 RDD family protein [Rhodococcus triatomae]QNG23092.1 RDD family protein [Rhodococcus triatomae]SDI15467.1 Uncharacterized membrane protein YckC, RDD family [Rhodococcus triatomae]